MHIVVACRTIFGRLNCEIQLNSALNSLTNDIYLFVKVAKLGYTRAKWCILCVDCCWLLGWCMFFRAYKIYIAVVLSGSLQAMYTLYYTDGDTREKNYPLPLSPSLFNFRVHHLNWWLLLTGWLADWLTSCVPLSRSHMISQKNIFISHFEMKATRRSCCESYASGDLLYLLFRQKVFGSLFCSVACQMDGGGRALFSTCFSCW